MKRLQLLLLMLLALPIGMLAAGKNWQTATSISNGGSASGTLSKDNTEEWMSIKVTEDGTAALTITPSGTLEVQYLTLYFYNSTDGQVYERGGTGQDSYTSVGKEKKTLTVANLAPGTYYVRANRWNGEGNYTVAYEFTPTNVTNDKEPNNAFNTAVTIEDGATLTGHLGYIYASDDDRDKDRERLFDTES